MPTPRKYPTGAVRQRAYRERQKAARQTQDQGVDPPRPAPIPTMPSTARWKAMLASAEQLLDDARKEMETYCDERSEAWQESQRAEAFQEAIERLDDLIANIKEAF